MSEQPENLPETLSKVSSLDDLQAALPPSLTSKLGEGGVGVKRMMNMLINLTPFVINGTFEKDAFDQIVAYDDEADESLSKDEAQKMLKVGLEAGFLTKIEGKTGERYKFDPQLHETMERLLQE